MRLYFDLHIHTALSPCGDRDMTPNNIVSMARLKGLDVIAITDHNTCENVSSCMKVGDEMDVLVIPGIELQTREDVHLLCLFDDINKIYLFQEYIYINMPFIPNNPHIFGEQLIFDSEDNIIGNQQRLLLTSTYLSLENACIKVEELGGVIIPAHIDRSSYSIISNLGFIPEGLNFHFLEYVSCAQIEKFIKQGLIKGGYKFIKSSDAHFLGDILERESIIEVDERNLSSILKILKG